MKAIALMPGADFPQVRLYADSAILRDVMPLFVPDLGVEWTSEVCLAARIVRLGKNIAPKFAPRYVDAIGMVNVLRPDTSTALGVALEQSGCCSVLDGVVTTGRWVEVDATKLIDVDVDVCGQKIRYTSIGGAIAALVSLASQFSTVKTGDIIILPFTAIPVPLIDNKYITASLLSQECLKLKVKR